MLLTQIKLPDIYEESNLLLWIELLGFCIFFLGGISFLIYLIYKPFKKRLIQSGKLSSKIDRRINLFWFLLPLLTSIIIVYFNIYPTNGYFKREFNKNTGLTLPDSAEILDKDYNYPDFFGDYSLSAIVKIDENEYASLLDSFIELETLGSISKIQDQTNPWMIFPLRRQFENLRFHSIYNCGNGHTFTVGFSEDKRTVVFERWSI